jgi:hypothetical protein
MQFRNKINHHFFDISKMASIKISGLDQFTHENLMWERALNFYKQENSFLKTRLSQVVDNNTDKAFVEQAEHYQNIFLFKDEYIKELCQDIRMQLELIKNAVPGNALHTNAMNRMQDKLRTEMEKFERDFSIQKNEFNKTLVSYILTIN